MTGRRTARWAALGLAIGLLLPSAASAGPFLGDWGWCWRPAADCPRGEYSPLHYWFMEWYRIRACAHPSYLDQYPPGPCPPVTAAYEDLRFPCRSTPPAPATPYATPGAYYGRPTALPFALP